MKAIFGERPYGEFARRVSSPSSDGTSWSHRRVEDVTHVTAVPAVADRRVDAVVAVLTVGSPSGGEWLLTLRRRQCSHLEVMVRQLLAWLIASVRLPMKG